MCRIYTCIYQDPSLFIFPNSEVDLITLNNDIMVKINGIILPTANLPYQHPTST